MFGYKIHSGWLPMEFKNSLRMHHKLGRIHIEKKRKIVKASIDAANFDKPFHVRMQKRHRILDQIIWRRRQGIECEATMKEVWITKNGK